MLVRDYSKRLYRICYGEIGNGIHAPDHSVPEFVLVFSGIISSKVNLDIFNVAEGNDSLCADVWLVFVLFCTK